MKSETIMLTLTIALAIALVAGLEVLPAEKRFNYYNTHITIHLNKYTTKLNMIRKISIMFRLQT